MGESSAFSGAVSVLFAAGHRLGALDDPAASEADVVVLDLEDTVPRGSKDVARAAVHAFVAKFAPTRGAALFLRPNLGPDGFDATELGLASRLAGVVLPKAESTADVARMISVLAALDRPADLGPFSIIATIETAAGVLHAEEVLSASPLVEAAIFGPSDLSLDLGITDPPSARGLAHARAHVALCAAAARIPAIDGGYGGPDEEGLTEDIMHARELGYAIKLTTRPAHVPVINRLMRPSPDQVERAKRTLDESDEVVPRAKAQLVLDRISLIEQRLGVAANGS